MSDLAPLSGVPTQRQDPAPRQASDLVQFIDVEKIYPGNVHAVRRLNLTIARGEFLTFLGPSGSGKTTTLNMLAGFERPTHGTITLEGRSVDRLPPYERNIGMVFQNYALFPHMTVAENVAFPLSVRKHPKSEIGARVKRALETVRLDHLAQRKPSQLSGGQQQRVALARALVFEPSLVLMDEPLGALDKKLREHMQLELKQLHAMLDVTIVYVTHDQSEALTMSDRVAVFDGGSIVQIGAPDALYNEPLSPFVANFVGENNALPGTIEAVSSSECVVRLEGGDRVPATTVGALRVGDRATIAVRPERIHLGNGVAAAAALDATVEGQIYLGDHQRLLARLRGGELLTVKIGPGINHSSGDPVSLVWSPTDCRAFPAEHTTNP